MSSFFASTALAPADPIFGLVSAFKQDPRPNKLSLVVGYYCDETGHVPVLETVRMAEKRLCEKAPHKEYLSITGEEHYLSQIGELLFGFSCQELEPRLVRAQTVGGTGALRQFADLYFHEVGKQVCLADPTWANHRGIFTAAGFAITLYPHYNRASHGMDFDKVLDTLHKLEEKTLIVFHASCHNPTGIDFTLEQWKVLSALCLKKRLFPLFDMAYQGFGQGLEKDAEAIHLFAKEGHELAVCYSCAKNFSLYGERVGALFLLASSSATEERIMSQLKQLIRRSYSNPPRHGAEIVKELLSDEWLKAKWKEELTQIRTRMKKIRGTLAETLKKKIPGQDVSFVTHSHGLFCYTGLAKEAVEKLKEKHAIYLPSDGRINITALNEHLERVVDAIASL